MPKWLIYLGLGYLGYKLLLEPKEPAPEPAPGPQGPTPGVRAEMGALGQPPPEHTLMLRTRRRRAPEPYWRPTFGHTREVPLSSDNPLVDVMARSAGTWPADNVYFH